MSMGGRVFGVHTESGCITLQSFPFGSAACNVGIKPTLASMSSTRNNSVTAMLATSVSWIRLQMNGWISHPIPTSMEDTYFHLRISLLTLIPFWKSCLYCRWGWSFLIVRHSCNYMFFQVITQVDLLICHTLLSNRNIMHAHYEQ